ncbi:hypothetical protein BU17DRAFT_69542 [Hysterangium stoloniferum]|nr:hypothetical protein BU17DRAFT_69542 [Hysterangium stoloniferum]
MNGQAWHQVMSQFRVASRLATVGSTLSTPSASAPLPFYYHRSPCHPRSHRQFYALPFAHPCSDAGLSGLLSTSLPTTRIAHRPKHWPDHLSPCHPTSASQSQSKSIFVVTSSTSKPITTPVPPFAVQISAQPNGAGRGISAPHTNIIPHRMPIYLFNPVQVRVQHNTLPAANSKGVGSAPRSEIYWPPYVRGTSVGTESKDRAAENGSEAQEAREAREAIQATVMVTATAMATGTALASAPATTSSGETDPVTKISAVSGAVASSVVG